MILLILIIFTQKNQLKNNNKFIFNVLLMEKKVKWANPLITFEVPNSWPAIRKVPLPKEGLSFGKKSVNLYNSNNNNNVIKIENFSEIYNIKKPLLKSDNFQLNIEKSKRINCYYRKICFYLLIGTIFVFLTIIIINKFL